MSRSYDRPPRLPRGSQPAIDDPYDTGYDAYDDQGVPLITGPPQFPPFDPLPGHSPETDGAERYGGAGQQAPLPTYGTHHDAGRDHTDYYSAPHRGMPVGPATGAPRAYAAASTGLSRLQPPGSGRAPPPASAMPDAPRSMPRASLDLGTAGQHPAPRGEMYAPARTAKTDVEQANAPIVPAGSVTGRSLTLVISIMCFLACLTVGAVYMMHQSSSAWLRDIASEVTVQIEPRDQAAMDKTLKELQAFLAKQPGIKNAKPLTVAESGALLEPWLGSSEALKSLPVPRLIALELDRAQATNVEDLRNGLDRQFKGVALDDHRQWQSQIRSVTRSFALGGLTILLLVAAATTAIIISATRAAMASNREIVEVLHFVGATDKFIAREFERNFLRLGVRAGLVGALSAMAVFALMPLVMELLGGGTLSLSEMRRLTGTGTLDPAGYAVLGLLVVIVAALCMLTSRFGVYRILHSRN